MRLVSKIAISGALMLAAAGCGQGGGASGEASKAAAPAAAPAPSAEEIQAIVAALPAPYNTADIDNGRRQFGHCRS